MTLCHDISCLCELGDIARVWDTMLDDLEPFGECK